MALESLRETKVPSDLSWELVVVDNNSSDDTREVVEGFKRSSGFEVQYVFEGRRGLANARNAGVMAAKGDIIGFTDDDCIVSPDWIASIAREFMSDPSLAGIGGRVELYNRNDRPVTIRTCKERIGFLIPRQLFNLMAGCNMAFTRQVFEGVGNFDPDFGAGGKFLSSEDSDFIYRAYKKGFKIVYCPDVLVYHNHGRKTDAQVHSLNRGYVIGRGAFYCKHILGGDRDILQLAYREVSWVTKTLIRTLFAGESIEKQRRLLRGLVTGAISKLTNNHL